MINLRDFDLQIFEIISKIVDLDIQLLEFWNILKNMEVQILDFLKYSQKYGGLNLGVWNIF